MRIFDADISLLGYRFFKSQSNVLTSLKNANELLQQECGIASFFEDDNDLLRLQKELAGTISNEVGENNVEYGDFQTNHALAKQIVQKLKSDGVNPQIVIEPTCGKGNFILALLNFFEHIETIYGIEIQKKYTWQAKFNILDYYLSNPNRTKPKIVIINYNIFDFNYNNIKTAIGVKELLIIGNPPWVTNSTLGVLNSKNLPTKINFKRQRGIDAMTGRGNFDIAEYITLDLLKHFGSCKGYMYFLVKNTVIKNILYELPKQKFHIGNIEKQNIDSKKEFGVSVDASLFCCKLNEVAKATCKESDFYTADVKCYFGWLNNRFIADFSMVRNDIEGRSPFEWRQGVKHDCSKVMELKREGDYFTNKLGESFVIETDLVYPLLKSSDLKSTVADRTDKMTIVTQRYVGQNTSYIKQYPQTFDYLCNHLELFKMRKSSIYKGKCDFSIFGVGDYSFKPYKVAISGLYKTFHFCLVKPQDDKPVMLDDTCYFIGFNTLEHAEQVWTLLNSNEVADFLKSISFKDAKRMITKEILMRIDLKKVAQLKELGNCFFDDLEEKHDSQLSLFS